jgi:hypothetical protein
MPNELSFSASEEATIEEQECSSKGWSSKVDGMATVLLHIIIIEEDHLAGKRFSSLSPADLDPQSQQNPHLMSVTKCTAVTVFRQNSRPRRTS